MSGERVRAGSGESDARTRSAAEAAVRRSYGKLVAILAARSGDVAAAEDALSEAFAAALSDWPQSGCPANPEAWLLTTATRKWIDAGRRQRTGRRFSVELETLAQELAGARARADASASDDFPDERLALVFACAHPALDASIRSPLVLQVVLGLDAATIASAFLTSPAAMSQRLVRAKSKIRQANIPFRIPDRAELPERLAAVLEAIYAAFGAGWSDPSGVDPAQRDLAEEALFLGRLVCELMPSEPEALGLLALMLYAESRRAARRDSAGEFVPLGAQDSELWDARMIDEAETLLRRARALGAIGRYQLEAALQSAHASRCRTQRDNWDAIVQLYDALLALSASPVVQLNRALAIAATQGPRAALASLPDESKQLRDYQPYWAARAELLAKAGDREEAERCYAQAIGLEPDPAVRRFLQRRQKELSISDKNT